MTATIPAKDDFSPNEILVQVGSAKPDSLNRIPFTAFWLDDYLPPGGVRGQVFFKDLDEFTACEQRWGRAVRCWSPDGNIGASRQETAAA